MEKTLLIVDQDKLRPCDVICCVVHQLAVFLLAPIDHAAILGDPHLTLKPIVELLAVSFRLHLPQLCFEDGRELVLGIFPNLHSAVLHSQPELLQLVGHRTAQAHGLHGAIQVGGLRDERSPLLVLRLGFGREAHGDVFLVVVVVDAVQPEGKLACRAGHRCDGCTSHLDTVQEDKALALLDAEVAKGAIASHPHVSFEPVRGICCVAICVELPQRALVERCLARRVLKALPGLTHDLLAALELC